jgi:hypothetical protein
LEGSVVEEKTVCVVEERTVCVVEERTVYTAGH